MNEKNTDIEEPDVENLLEQGEIDGTDLPESTNAVMEFFAEEAEKIGIKPELFASIYIDFCNPIITTEFRTSTKTLISTREFTFYPFPGPDHTLIVESGKLGIETAGNSRDELITRVAEEMIHIFQETPESLVDENENPDDIFTLKEGSDES